MMSLGDINDYFGRDQPLIDAWRLLTEATLRGLGDALENA